MCKFNFNHLQAYAKIYLKLWTRPKHILSTQKSVPKAMPKPKFV